MGLGLPVEKENVAPLQKRNGDHWIAVRCIANNSARKSKMFAVNWRSRDSRFHKINRHGHNAVQLRRKNFRGV